VPLKIRLAERRDVQAIVRLLAHDVFGEQRECATEPLPSSYYEAFAAIAADPNQELTVAELDGVVVGTLQLTILQNLDYQGGRRGLIEAVRVAGEHRSRGIGADLLRYAIERARARGCHLVQLTSDKRRVDARRFYERLGFRATHEGMKLVLS
jgi:GNAT superfamily N-acetyltransferase